MRSTLLASCLALAPGLALAEPHCSLPAPLAAAGPAAAASNESSPAGCRDIVSICILQLPARCEGKEIDSRRNFPLAGEMPVAHPPRGMHARARHLVQGRC